MALSYTYTTLKAALVNWTEDDSTEFAAVLDDVIGLGELRICRDVDLSVFRETATTALVANDRFLAKPSDMVIDRSLRIMVNGSYRDLDRKDTSFITEYWPNPTTTGLPRYYSDWNENSFIIAATSDDAYVVELDYTKRPDGLSGSTPTTWLSTKAPDVLLWACMVEAIPFLKEPNSAEWEAKYMQRLESLAREEMARQRRYETRTGEPRGSL